MPFHRRDSLTPSLLLLTLLLFPALAFAQDSTPDPGSVLDLLIRAINDWRTLGALAGVTAVVNALVNLTKIPVIAEWIEAPGRWSEDKKWIRPILSVVTSVLAAVALAVPSGSNIPTAMGRGVLTGMSAIGLHEVVNAILAAFGKKGSTTSGVDRASTKV